MVGVHAHRGAERLDAFPIHNHSVAREVEVFALQSGARGLATSNLTRGITFCKLRILGMGREAQKNDSLPGSLDMLINPRWRSPV